MSGRLAGGVAVVTGAGGATCPNESNVSLKSLM